MDVAQKVSAFFAKYPQRSYAKRELLLRAEEPIKNVYLVVSGLVSQYDITVEGNEVVVNVFKPGAFFPMSSAINGGDNHYFFEASSNTVVQVAPVSEAVQFLRDNPDVMFDLLARVYRGVDGVLRRMAHLMGGDARTRLVFEILNAAVRFGEITPQGVLKVAITESDLARRAGLARETVNRVLQSLKAEELVEITRGGLTILQKARLEEELGTKV